MLPIGQVSAKGQVNQPGTYLPYRGTPTAVERIQYTTLPSSPLLPTYLTLQVKIWNTRLRLMQLVESARDMGKYGPSKPPAEHGLDEVRCCRLS